jgi:hypothetical protein
MRSHPSIVGRNHGRANHQKSLVKRRTNPGE